MRTTIPRWLFYFMLLGLMIGCLTNIMSVVVNFERQQHAGQYCLILPGGAVDTAQCIARDAR